jgi:hypothetical protein
MDFDSKIFEDEIENNYTSLNNSLRVAIEKFIADENSKGIQYYLTRYPDIQERFTIAMNDFQLFKIKIDNERESAHNLLKRRLIEKDIEQQANIEREISAFRKSYRNNINSNYLENLVKDIDIFVCFTRYY